MSTKLLKTQDYLLLIDEEAEIKAGSYYITNLGNIYKETERPFEEDKGVERFSNRSLYKPIIAYYPLTKEAKELDLPLLPNPFKEIDVEKLAFNYTLPSGFNRTDAGVSIMEAFIAGYKSASKQFNLEDIKKAIEMAREYEFIRFGDRDTENKYTEEEIIQLLSTQQLPKEFVPEYRYYYQSSKEFYSDAGFVECSKEQYESIKVEISTCPLKAEIKTITNLEGREEIMGIYKY